MGLVGISACEQERWSDGGIRAGESIPQPRKLEGLATNLGALWGPRIGAAVTPEEEHSLLSTVFLWKPAFDFYPYSFRSPSIVTYHNDSN
jgi:hypothetical protein